jgi:hypothetical protein
MSATNNFDLNISNYKKDELEEIFALPSGGNYDALMIEMKCSQLKDNVGSDKSVEDSVRMKTITFLEEAKKMLLSEIQSSHLLQKLGDAYNVNNKLETSEIIDAGNTFIIDKPKTSFANSFPGEFFPGIINPLKKRTIQKNLNVDTRFRDNYYTSSPTNFYFDLPIKFTDVLNIQLSAFEMPTNFYNISSKMGNNYFYISIDSTGQKYPILVTDGYYTAEGLISYLNEYVLTEVTELNTFEFIYATDAAGNNTGKLFINSTTGANFSLIFNTDIDGNTDNTIPLPLKLGWVLGFRLGFYTGASSYEGETFIDLATQKYVYLVVDDFNNNVNNNFYNAFNTSILNQNILARISFQNNNVLGNTVQNNLSLITTPRQYFGPVNIQKLHIQLLDEYGRVIDMNNMDYSFCLTFHVVYDL